MSSMPDDLAQLKKLIVVRDAQIDGLIGQIALLNLFPYLYVEPCMSLESAASLPRQGISNEIR